MRIFAAVVLLLLASMLLTGQEARVIPLEVKDADAARQSWENLQHAQQSWDHLQELLRDKYTVVPEGDKDASNTIIPTSRVSFISTLCADQVLTFNGKQVPYDEGCHKQQEKERQEHPSLTFRRGWENGFQFSSDFKFIVPKQVVQPSTPSYQYWPADQWHFQNLPAIPTGISVVPANYQKVTIIGGCDESVWSHTYHQQRLVVSERCASVTGITVDATHGKNKDGCRHEADGDGHCFLKLDPGQEKYVNAMNVKNEGGNLVFEPECRYRVTQADAQTACKNWKQDLKLPPVGTHVRITGAAVLDTQHGHREIHPVSSIEVLK